MKPDHSGCYKVVTTNPTLNTYDTPAAGDDNANYGQWGIRIYNLNDFNGTGNSISGTYGFEGNTALYDGSSTTSVETFWSTRMNDNNVWVSGNPTYMGMVSFCTTITLTETKTYYIGIAGDNDVTIKINGTTIVDQADNSPQSNFKFWHVYPYQLNAGDNIIELENYNRSSVGSFSAEIYNNTLTELSNATSTSMITRVFSTGDYLPGGSKAGQGFCSNYSCPTGYLLNTSNPNNYLCVKNEYVDCGAIIPTPTPTPSSTPRDCVGCTSYDIVITQGDINLSTDGKVYAYYYPCGTSTGDMSFVTFSNPGTYIDHICTDNCSTEPYVCIQYDGGCTSPQNNSRLVEKNGDCTPSSPVSRSCGTTITKTITTSGKVSLLDYFVLDNDYGNFTVTVSGTQQNDIAELFVGNFNEGYGEIVTLSKGANNKTQNVGYYNSKGGKNVDLSIYSSSSTAFQPYTINITVSCTDTVDCTSVVTGVTETYVKNTTLNVTTAGIIHYSIDGQNDIAVNVPVGTHTITSCYIYETLNPLLIVNNPASYTVTYSGTTCISNDGSEFGTCSNITFVANQGFSATAWWIDCNGDQKTQFVSTGQSLTVEGINGSGSGLPLTYTNLNQP
jgi:hypothetical protein